MFYKDPEGNLHYIDSLDDEPRLPVGSVRIFDKEAQEIIQARLPEVDLKASIRDKIAILEASITQRRLREAMLTGDKSFIERVDAEIFELRKQLQGVQ